MAVQLEIGRVKRNAAMAGGVGEWYCHVHQPRLTGVVATAFAKTRVLANRRARIMRDALIAEAGDRDDSMDAVEYIRCPECYDTMGGSDDGSGACDACGHHFE